MNVNRSVQVYSQVLNTLQFVLSLAKSKNYFCTETCAMRQISMVILYMIEESYTQGIVTVSTTAAYIFVFEF